MRITNCSEEPDAGFGHPAERQREKSQEKGMEKQRARETEREQTLNIKKERKTDVKRTQEREGNPSETKTQQTAKFTLTSAWVPLPHGSLFLSRTLHALGGRARHC